MSTSDLGNKCTAEKLQDPQRFGLQEMIIDPVSAGLRYKILTYVPLVGISTNRNKWLH
jgi:hypothetical protein